MNMKLTKTLLAVALVVPFAIPAVAADRSGATDIVGSLRPDLQGDEQTFIFIGESFQSKRAFIESGRRCASPLKDELETEAIQAQVQDDERLTSSSRQALAA